MTSAQLRAEAERHERDADYHERDAASHAGRAAFWRAHGDPERARVWEIMQAASEKCEQRALFRAAAARTAARRIEEAQALMNVGVAA